MAQISAATLEATLNPLGLNKSFQVIKSMNLSGTIDMFYVIAGIYQTANPNIVPGRARWCQTTIAGNAAAQAAEVKTAMAG